MHTLDYDRPFAVFVQLGLAPLLELHDHIGVAAGAPVNPRQHHVRPPAGQRKLVLDQHLDVAKAGVHEVLRQNREAALPDLRSDSDGDRPSSPARSVMIPASCRSMGEPTTPAAETLNTVTLPRQHEELVRVGACPRS